jgi:hypothetical protein
MSGICTLIGKFTAVIINPLLELIFAAGLFVFVFGIAEYLCALSRGSHDAEKGRWHMLYGIGGMFIMASAWAIIQLIANTVGVNLSCTL